MPKKNQPDKARLKLAVQTVQNEFVALDRFQASIRAAYEKIDREFQSRRRALLGPVHGKMLADAGGDGIPSASRSQADKMRKLATLAQFYAKAGIDPSALARLESERRTAVSGLIGSRPAHVRMDVAVPHAPTDIVGTAGRQSFAPPFFANVTHEEFGLFDEHVLGAHNDMTTIDGSIGANLYEAHFAEFTGPGDSYAYARNTGGLFGPITVERTTNFRITVVLRCESSVQVPITRHTEWWDPRDSDSIIDLVDTFIIGFSRTIFSEPFTQVGAAELGTVHIIEDDGIDSRTTFNPGDRLQLGTVLGLSPADISGAGCGYVFIGLRHYAFIWAKYVKFSIQAYCQWRVESVTLDPV